MKCRLHFFQCVFFLGLSLVLVGCGNQGLKEAQQFVADTKAKSLPPIPPIPELSPPKQVKYSSASLRDPFLPQPRLPATGPGANRNKEELEAFSLDSLRMVGTLTEQNKVWALIQAPNKTVYKVTVGSYMGQNYGKIIEIKPNEIKLIETIPDGINGWKQRRASMLLVAP